MASITANDLKTKGVSVVESALQEDGEAVITVRGKRKYVVLDFTTYNKLREYELELALQETRADIASGSYRTESVEEHMQRVLGE
ncbi:MAG: prevent-host-death protein [SAR86 cluster bacterium]|uniref:Prevent-host-death protein n=1 Tax=SAR86 cluster bacterium TaxID=2030880 RepID=A0A2A4MRQ1_9GAMM|nr:MAG: prevent-host-death protein [SAR86 cluster bacterium]